MAERLRYHPRVAEDIAAAIDWYESRSVGLGERFRAAVDARFDDIGDAPRCSHSLLMTRIFGLSEYRSFHTCYCFVCERRTCKCSGCFTRRAILQNGVVEAGAGEDETVPEVWFLTSLASIRSIRDRLARNRRRTRAAPRVTLGCYGDGIPSPHQCNHDSGNTSSDDVCARP